MALSLILPQKTLEEVKDKISVKHSYCGPLTPIEPQDENTEICSTVCTQLLSPGKCNPVSLAEIKERCRKIKERPYVDERDVGRIEKETVGQLANEKWNLHRKIRITASKCNWIATLHLQQRLSQKSYITSRYLKQGQ